MMATINNTNNNNTNTKLEMTSLYSSSEHERIQVPVPVVEEKKEVDKAAEGTATEKTTPTDACSTNTVSTEEDSSISKASMAEKEEEDEQEEEKDDTSPVAPSEPEKQATLVENDEKVTATEAVQHNDEKVAEGVEDKKEVPPAEQEEEDDDDSNNEDTPKSNDDNDNNPSAETAEAAAEDKNDTDVVTTRKENQQEQEQEQAKTSNDDEDSTSDSDSEEDIPQFPRLRSSIKLKTLTADIPVKLGRKSFRTLPKPDMDKVRKAATLPAYMSPEDVFRIMSGTNHDEEDRGDLKVQFDNVNIRNYKQTIGDNPSVSYGTPIALDWNYEEQGAISLEDYEQQRDGLRRPFKKLGLNYYQRKALLERQGHSDQDVKKAQKQASKDKFKRAITKYFLPVRALEDAAESGVRKMKRTFGNKKDKKGRQQSS